MANAVPMTDPFYRCPMGTMKAQAEAGFRKHRHMVSAPGLLINLLYLPWKLVEQNAVQESF